MSKTSFGRLLSANAVSSIIGTGIQAATAPVFLYILTINQYALILLAQTVAGYLGFFLNGFYYFLMNSITHESINHRHEKAQEFYTLGYFTIVLLCAVCATGTILTLLVVQDARHTTILVLVATLSGLINLSYVLVDANFRVRNEYTLGVNLLTFARLVDFVLLVSALALTRDLLLSLLINVLTRAVTIFALKGFVERRPGAISLGWKISGLRELGRFVLSSRGQFGLSAYTALSVMGPQLFVSAFFPDVYAVAFNVHRTYMRLVAALVNIATASSWPVLNSLHANGRSAEISSFLRKLVGRSMILTSGISALLFLVAPWAFTFLFHDKVPANSEYLFLIGLACVFNGGTTIGQTLYLATNLRSGFILAAFLLTIVELLSMTAVGLHYGFTAGLVVYANFEFVIMTSALIGCAKTLRWEEQLRVKRGDTCK